jgi:hypothetical protein
VIRIGVIFAMGVSFPFQVWFCLQGETNLHPLRFTQSKLHHLRRQGFDRQEDGQLLRQKM